MEFSVETEIGIAYERYFETVLSDTFAEWLKQHLKDARFEIARNDQVGAQWHRTVIWTHELPDKLRKILKVPDLILEDRQVISPDEGTLEWTYIPNVGAKRFSARGTGRIRRIDAGVSREISGEVSLKIPLVGKRIASQVITFVRKGEVDAKRAIESYLHEIGG
jgi:hypothetical protein